MDITVPTELVKVMAIALGVAAFTGGVGWSLAEIVKDLLSKKLTLGETEMKAMSGIISVVCCVYLLTRPMFGMPVDLAIMASLIAIYAPEKWHDLLKK